MLYRSTIQNYTFEIEVNSSRIQVYRAGTLDPYALIYVELPISEKDFHMEIMHWYSTKNPI